MGGGNVANIITIVHVASASRKLESKLLQNIGMIVNSYRLLELDTAEFLLQAISNTNLDTYTKRCRFT